MFVSVAIAAYNAGNYLREAIASALAQTRKPDEIVVVDDGSVDNTREVCESFGAAVRYFYQENDGTYGVGARARAVRETRGDWIALLDHDDRWLPDKLEKQVNALEGHPDAGVVFTRYYWIDPEGQQLLVPGNPMLERPPASGETQYLDSHAALHILLTENQFCPASALIRRDLVLNNKPDADQQGCGDWYLWLDVVRHGAGVIIVDQYLTEYRLFGQNFCDDKNRLATFLQRTLDLQKDQLRPGCSECTAAFNTGRQHVSHVFSVAARTFLDQYHQKALEGDLRSAFPFLYKAVQASPGEVFRPRRMFAASKNGAIGAIRGITRKG